MQASLLVIVKTILECHKRKIYLAIVGHRLAISSIFNAVDALES
jgi:hypothetical protein